MTAFLSILGLQKILISLGRRESLILRSTYNVTGFWFLTPFRMTFDFLFKNAAKLRGSTGGTIRNIIILVRASKKNFSRFS